MIEGETHKQQYDMALEMFENQILFPCTTEVIDFPFTLRRFIRRLLRQNQIVEYCICPDTPGNYLISS